MDIDNNDNTNKENEYKIDFLFNTKQLNELITNDTKETTDEQNIGNLSIVASKTQAIKITPNPLVDIFLCFENKDFDIWNYCQMLSIKYNVWPKKLSKYEQKINDRHNETICDFMDDVLKTFFPKYKTWNDKVPLEFVTFCEILEEYYTLLNNTCKIHFNYMRLPTTKYRQKHELQGKKINQLNKQYHPYIIKLIKMKEEENKEYDYANDDNEVDHILSVKVFSTICVKISDLENYEYSYDRYFSLISWINKCWNFIALPSKVNNLKGKIECDLIGIITKIPSLTFNPKDYFSDIYVDYFKYVVDNINNNMKNDSLDQMKQFKDAFVKFLNNFKKIELTAQDYKCGKDCFCRRDLSYCHRLHTFHLFITYEIQNISFIIDNANNNCIQKYMKQHSTSRGKISQKRKTLYDKLNANQQT